MPPKASSISDPNIQPKDKSQAQFFREAGFKSHYDFNLSYGVKPGDDDGHEQMKDLVKQMRESDQAEWESKNGKK
jgi:hypothetical protein